MNEVDKANAAIEAELIAAEYSSIRFPTWPDPPAAEVYHGLVGEIVNTISPHSEADPAALVIDLIICAGNLIGRQPHFRAESDLHFSNLFAVLVGETSKGRKGSSWGHIKRISEIVDPTWHNERLQNGLSSGEGVIWAVRDAVEKRESNGKKDTSSEPIMLDPGVDDKRLMVVESEFGSVLQAINRQGNTLSPIIRQAWDDGDLRVLTKNNPACATGSHISILGHITRDELTRHLNRTEAANGFGNRILWVCVKRSKILPEGGNLQENEYERMGTQLRNVVKFASDVREIRRDEDAREIWFSVYEKLSEGQPGLVGALTSRSEAQVMRLACLYALMDCSLVIKADHLLAALALWDYCQASVHYIFGEAVGDPIIDKIWEALFDHPEGLSRTDISKILGTHVAASRITNALATLKAQGKAYPQTLETGGRNAERWYAVKIHAK